VVEKAYHIFTYDTLNLSTCSSIFDMELTQSKLISHIIHFIFIVEQYFHLCVGQFKSKRNGYKTKCLVSVLCMSNMSDIGPDVSGILEAGISDEKPMKRPGLEVL